MKQTSLFSRLLSALIPAPTNATFGASAVNERNVTQGVDWNAVYRDLTPQGVS